MHLLAALTAAADTAIADAAVGSAVATAAAAHRECSCCCRYRHCHCHPSLMIGAGGSPASAKPHPVVWEVAMEGWRGFPPCMSSAEHSVCHVAVRRERGGERYRVASHHQAMHPARSLHHTLRNASHRPPGARDPRQHSNQCGPGTATPKR